MNIDFINSILTQWSCENVPAQYTPYKEGDYVFIYGDCTGIVIYPDINNFLGYMFFEEDDGFYYYNETKQQKHVYWMKSDIKCLEIAIKYLEEHATPEYYVGCEGDPDMQCGWKLPWKN